MYVQVGYIKEAVSPYFTSKSYLNVIPLVVTPIKLIILHPYNLHWVLSITITFLLKVFKLNFHIWYSKHFTTIANWLANWQLRWMPR